MSNLSAFMKQNKKTKNNTKIVATKDFCDEKGNPIEWEIRPISTAENDAIREKCTKELQVVGRPGLFRERLDVTLYLRKLLCASVVYPNLKDAELLDSYGVMSPEDLLLELIDNPGEYGEFAEFVQKFNGFIPIEEEVKAAKN